MLADVPYKAGMGYIRVRGEIPERDIAVHGLVMADGLEHACRVPVQTPGLRNLTDAACMPDLTVEEYEGKGVCEARTRGHFIVVAVGREQVRNYKTRFGAILRCEHF